MRPETIAIHGGFDAAPAGVAFYDRPKAALQPAAADAAAVAG